MRTNFENSANGSAPLEEAKCVTATMMGQAPLIGIIMPEIVLMNTLRKVGKSLLCTTPLGVVVATAWDSKDSISRLCTGKAICSKELIRDVGSNAGKNACRAVGVTLGKVVGKAFLPGIGAAAGIAFGGFLADRLLDDVSANAEKEQEDY